MNFLTDENIARSVVKQLRQGGHDVRDIKEEKLYGISDIEIINRAREENRIVITHDKDFGNIIKNQNLNHKGIILIRCKNQSPSNVSDIIDKLLNSEIIDKIEDSLIIVSEEQIVVYKKQN